MKSFFTASIQAFISKDGFVVAEHPRSSSGFSVLTYIRRPANADLHVNDRVLCYDPKKRWESKGETPPRADRFCRGLRSSRYGEQVQTAPENKHRSPTQCAHTERHAKKHQCEKRDGESGAHGGLESVCG